MTWFRSFGSFETILAIAFVVLYIINIVRTVRAAKGFRLVWGTLVAKFVLRSLIVALMLIAFLGPSFGESNVEIQSIGKDIVICVDLSKSMDAFDVPPTRLQKIKFEMKRIIRAFHSDRIGIIIFSSEAFVQSPLTYDRNALNLFAETMNTGLVPPSGTDFEPPLQLALKKLTDEQFSKSKPKSKIILFISDGEDFGDNTESIAQEVKEKGIRLYTLGVGTQRGSRIRTQRGFKTDKEGNPVVTHLKPESLKRLAQQTGGSYFEISETKNDMSRLISSIESIEGELQDVRRLDIATNRYDFFLLTAMALLLLDFVITPKLIRI